MMRYLFVLIIALGPYIVCAQRYVYVDSKYILENMETYKEAQIQLNVISKRWQETIEAKMMELDRISRAYNAEKILLTPDLQTKRETEIKEKEEEIRGYQREKFGVNGELFKKRNELIQPIQNEIFNAIKEMAKERSYALVFDKGINSNILFSDPKYDKSDAILKKLGYSGRDK